MKVTAEGTGRAGDLCDIKADMVVPAGQERQPGGPGRRNGAGEKKQGRESINTNFI